ncbi:MAG: hypothetical protein ACLTKG_03030 [Collinsella intestinalis]
MTVSSRYVRTPGYAREIRVDHLTRLGHGDIERLGQAVCLLAVYDAEVHRLGAAAQLWVTSSTGTPKTRAAVSAWKSSPR